jgi:uncharacterized HAD superfamily protein
MNIGIDVDGVILDTENWFRSMSYIYDMQIGGNGPVCPDEVKVQDRMKWSDKDFTYFVENCMYYGMENAPLMPCCKFVIDKLREMGHRLVLITARGIFSQKEIDLANEMLEKNKLKFDALCYDSQDKLIPCRNEKIDYMIDDSVNNVRRLSENGVKCLYFRDYGSQDIHNDNVIDVANWGEIYRFFSELK